MRVNECRMIVPLWTLKLSADERDEIRARFLATYRGDARVIVLSGPADYTPIPTIGETIARLDRAIANVRRFA